MANRSVTVTQWPGAASAALVLFLTLGTLVSVAIRAEGFARLGPADYAAIRFTLNQAIVSAALSVGLAIPVARALARRSFFGRSIFVTLLGAPFILPVIVAVLGLLAVFGRNGLVSSVLAWFGLEPIRIYGFHGVVLAHVFFNLPLATRLLLQGWQAIPAERFRLAASLGFRPHDVQRQLELPMLRSIVPGALLVVFLICTTSFAVALTLGGGPKATTVELAIYQAFRFDFDLAKAALLAVIQFCIGGTAAALAFRFTGDVAGRAGMDRPPVNVAGKSLALLLQDCFVIAFAAAFLIAPLVMIVLSGLPNLFDLPKEVVGATFRSLIVAVSSAALAGLLALTIAMLAQSLRRWSGAVEAIGYLSIAASPLVIGTGLFIFLFPITDPIVWALPITAMVNAVMALPFALRSIVPALAQIENDFGRLSDSLGLSGWARLRVVTLPRLKRPLGFATGLAAALSMGDLGVIALFADPDYATLPLQMYRLMGSYQMQDAAAAGLILLVCSLALFWLFDRGGRLDAGA